MIPKTKPINTDTTVIIYVYSITFAKYVQELAIVLCLLDCFIYLAASGTYSLSNKSCFLISAIVLLAACVKAVAPLGNAIAAPVSLTSTLTLELNAYKLGLF